MFGNDESHGGKWSKVKKRTEVSVRGKVLILGHKRPR